MKNVPDIAKRLGISKQSVWKLIYTGQLSFVRIGRSIRVRDEDIEAFIKRNLQRRSA